MSLAKYKLKTAPSIIPISLNELKRNLHIIETNTDQDTYLGEIISGVVDVVQTDIGRQLCLATYTAFFDSYPAGDELELELGPVSGISSVKYYADDATDLTTVSASDYQLDNTELTARLRFLNSFSTDADRLNAVEIEFTAGWGSADDVPRGIKDALLLLCSDRYLNPENPMLNFGASIRQTAAERLLRNYRVQRF
jgi:uncharacterized phiE125 gp8 family phage protein